MLRNVLNHEGVVVGQVSFPDSMSESEIETKLAVYAAPPAVEKIADVTPRQIRQALVLHGVVLADIETALDSLPEPTKSLAKIEWEYSVMFKRDNPLVSQVGAVLGWTDEQLNNLWKFASAL